jgi:hypothetical protein
MSTVSENKVCQQTAELLYYRVQAVPGSNTAFVTLCKAQCAIRFMQRVDKDVAHY